MYTNIDLTIFLSSCTNNFLILPALKIFSSIVFSRGEDPDPDGTAFFYQIQIRIFLRIRIQGIFFGSKYGDFYIIDQISKKPWYFFTVN